MTKKFILSLCIIATSLFAHTVKQKTDNLEQLLLEAKETQSRLIAILKSVTCGVYVIDPGIKGMETITRLLKTRNTADEITDYSRATIVVKDFQSIYWCLEELKKYFNILSIDDHYLHPYKEMYRDINVVFEDPENMHIGEIQINSQAMAAFKNIIGHDIFDKIRIIQAREKLENRPLTKEENEIIGDLTLMSKIGYESAFKKSCGAIRIGIYGICINNNKVLMVKTFSGDKYIYNFPGGGIEPYESLEDCLKRECIEELGCSIVIEKLLATSSKLYENIFIIISNLVFLFYFYKRSS